jgi:hypothetical protein
MLCCTGLTRRKAKKRSHSWKRCGNLEMQPSDTLWQRHHTFTRDWLRFRINIVQKMGQLSGRSSSSRDTRPISTARSKQYLHPKKRMAAETIGTELLYGIPANSGGRLAIRSAR